MTSNGGFFYIYILNENKTLWVVLHHFLFHSRVNLAFLPLNLPCWVFCFWFKSRLEVTPVCEGTRYHLKRSPRLFKTRPTLSNHQTAAPMWREFQHSGQFSIVTAQHTRVTEPFTGSPVYQKQSSTNEKFWGDWAAANRTAAAWKIWISLCDHTLASQTGETPPEEEGIVSFLGSTMRFRTF